VAAASGKFSGNHREVAQRLGIGDGEARRQRRQQRGQRQAQAPGTRQAMHARGFLQRGAAVLQAALGDEIDVGHGLERQGDDDARRPEQQLRHAQGGRPVRQRADGRGQQHPARGEEKVREDQQQPHAGFDPAARRQVGAHAQPGQPGAQRQRQRAHQQRHPQRVPQRVQRVALRRLSQRGEGHAQVALQHMGHPGREQKTKQGIGPQRREGQRRQQQPGAHGPAAQQRARP
jgi:hypothetical protein